MYTHSTEAVRALYWLLFPFTLCDLSLRPDWRKPLYLALGNRYMNPGADVIKRIRIVVHLYSANDSRRFHPNVQSLTEMVMYLWFIEVHIKTSRCKWVFN